MERADFDALVTRIEDDAHLDPGRVLRRAYLHVALGYAYVLGVLGLIIGAGILSLTSDLPGDSYLHLLIAVPLLAFAVVILHGFRAHVERPAGYYVGIAQARALHGRVDEIRARLRAPRPDGVILTRDFNAGVMEATRYGPFGRPRRFLSLGLPMLCGLTTAQVDAVLAHEFAHFASGHTTRGFRLFRAARAWEQLMLHMEGTGAWATPVFRRFFHWFIPRLRAFGLALSRRSELQADAEAARVTTPDDLASALIAIGVRGRGFSLNWAARTWLAARERDEVPEEVWTKLPDALREIDTWPARRSHVAFVLRASADVTDSHPPLRERLRALGFEFEGIQEAIDHAESMLGRLGEPAVGPLLGDLGDRLLRALDEEWRAEVAPEWRATHAHAETMRRRLVSLEAIEQDGNPPTTDELHERLDLLTQLEGPHASRATAERLLALDASDAMAHAVIAGALLLDGDPAGLPHADRVIAMDIETTPMMTGYLSDFHEARRDEEGVRDVARKVAAYERAVREGFEEREVVRRGDHLERSELPEDLVDAIRVACMRSHRIGSVLVARKRVRFRPHRPFLVVVLRRTAFGRTSPFPPKEVIAEFMESITEPMPECLVLLDDPEQQWLVDHLSSAPLATEIRA